MKAAIVLLAFVGCSLYASCQADLQGDLDKILSLIPEEEITAIVKNYINRGDSQVMELLEYMSSDEHKRLIVKVRAVPGVQDVISKLQSQGVNVDDLFQRLLILLGLPPLEVVYYKNPGTDLVFGLRDMFEEIQSILPINQLLGVFLETLIESEDLQDFFGYLQKPETYQTVMDVLEIVEVKLLIVRMKNYGVDVDKIAVQITTILGWS